MKPFFLLLGAFILCHFSCNQSKNTGASEASAEAVYVDINVDEFAEKKGQKNTIVLDVRTPKEIAEGKIPNAVELDYYSEGFSSELEKLDKSKTYLVYCRSGNRSGKTCGVMIGKGFRSVYNLEGGYTAWSEIK